MCERKPYFANGGMSSMPQYCWDWAEEYDNMEREREELEREREFDENQMKRHVEFYELVERWIKGEKTDDNLLAAIPTTEDLGDFLDRSIPLKNNSISDLFDFGDPLQTQKYNFLARNF